MRLSLAPASLLAGLLCLVSNGPIPAAADQEPFFNDLEYDNQTYGRYPVQEFRSTDAIAPRVNILRQDERCQNDLYTFFAPRGYAGSAHKAQASIFDQHGHLVWTTGWPKSQIYNLMVQEWKGENYLTFWAGNDAVGGHGAGHYYMFDKHYNLTRTISAVQGLHADLHDFKITPEGTVLLTVYDRVDVDLSGFGKTVGPVWDCMIQEFDLETEEVIFSWRATEHIALSGSMKVIGGDGEPGGEPWDWFHINSIDKDDKGNYLISSRWFQSLFYIDHTTGDVKWTLGGRRNSFKDLSSGKATNIRYQHHARWADEGFANITIFDNAAFGGDQPARGIRVHVDQDAMTARLVDKYISPEKTPAAAQGSIQDLPNGNVLVGYGFSAAWTEFSRDGEVLCDTHFGPSRGFGHGDAQSYRVLKYDWQGWPLTDPDVAVTDEAEGLWMVSVSWNGATQVREWTLEGANSSDDESRHWIPLETLPKDGFETQFQLQRYHPSYLRVQARDANGQILGTTKTVNATDAIVQSQTANPDPDQTANPDPDQTANPDPNDQVVQLDSSDGFPPWVWGLVGAVCGASAVLLVLAAWRGCSTRRAGRVGGGPRGEAEGYKKLQQLDEPDHDDERSGLKGDSLP